jgi:ribonuclease HI
MEKTAIEFIVKELIKLGYLHSSDYSQSPNVTKVINQAKEMERQQFINILELKELKNIIETKLNAKKRWVDAERGHNYNEHCKRELIYSQDEHHEKLKKINEQINQIIKSI